MMVGTIDLILQNLNLYLYPKLLLRIQKKRIFIVKNIYQKIVPFGYTPMINQYRQSLEYQQIQQIRIFD